MSLRSALSISAGCGCLLAVLAASAAVSLRRRRPRTYRPGRISDRGPRCRSRCVRTWRRSSGTCPARRWRCAPTLTTTRHRSPGSAPGLGTLFVFSLVLFGAFVLAARTLVWAPLIAALDQRESRVNQAQADAEAAKHEAEHLLAQHSARMAQVHEQVQGLIAQTRKEAEQEKSRIIAEAEAQARSLRDRAVAEIQQARDVAIGQLHGALDHQVARAVEQVVGHAV